MGLDHFIQPSCGAGHSGVELVMLEPLRVLLACVLIVGSASGAVPVGIVFDESMADHDNGAHHPESAQRLFWIKEGLTQRGMVDKLSPVRARPATDAQILTVHTKAHLASFSGDSTTSSPVPESTRKAARLAAGAGIAACDAVLEGKVKRAFCAVRPPGHHAGPESAEGFCYFNNIAIAARHVQKVHGLERILILDWDVHAGNGTYAIFKKDPTVFDFHVHQDPTTIYPGTGFEKDRGEEEGLGFSANHPLPIGTKGDEVDKILSGRLREVCERFRPQFILISAGFDMHEADPLGELKVTNEDYAAMTTTVVGLAEEFCNGRIVSMLEGGYSKEAMLMAVPAHIEALMQPALIESP